MAVKSDDENIFTFLYVVNMTSKPSLQASVLVRHDLSIEIFLQEKPLSSSIIAHLLSVDEKLTSVTEIANILLFVKSLIQSENIEATQQLAYIDVACDLLENVLKNPSFDEQRPLLSFIVSQLRLLFMSSTGRRYSNELVISAFTWKIISPALYKKLLSFFILPSVRRLQQLSSSSAVHCNNIDLSYEYMHSRISNICDNEKYVVLIIDKVYTASRIEYQNGEFVGMTEDGATAKTILAFMVQSLSSKYKDVVKLVPILKLTTSTLKRFFYSIIQEIHSIGLYVQCVSADNHAVNR